MKKNIIVYRITENFGLINFFTPIISSRKYKKNEYILLDLESNKNVSNLSTFSTNEKIVKFDSSKLFPNYMEYLGQFYIKNNTLAQQDKIYLTELYKWKYGWKNPVMEGFEYCISEMVNNVILLYVVQENDGSRPNPIINMVDEDAETVVETFPTSRWIIDDYIRNFLLRMDRVRSTAEKDRNYVQNAIDNLRNTNLEDIPPLNFNYYKELAAELVDSILIFPEVNTTFRTENKNHKAKLLFNYFKKNPETLQDYVSAKLETDPQIREFQEEQFRNDFVDEFRSFVTKNFITKNRIKEFITVAIGGNPDQIYDTYQLSEQEQLDYPGRRNPIDLTPDERQEEYERIYNVFSKAYHNALLDVELTNNVSYNQPSWDTEELASINDGIWNDYMTEFREFDNHYLLDDLNKNLTATEQADFDYFIDVLRGFF